MTKACFPRAALMRLVLAALALVAVFFAHMVFAGDGDETTKEHKIQQQVQQQQRDLQVGNRRFGVCGLRRDVGPCDGVFPRWFYNSTSEKCEMFDWGGCGGNDNNYEALEECEHRCVCTLPADPGPCEALVPRWFYDATIGQCTKFNYGGCEGNDNNFAKLKSCKTTCPMDRCDLPVDPGPCRGAFTRWYYNSDTATCEMFSYGGCMGNANNFETPQGCEMACKTCKLPTEVGPCEAAIPRWSYRPDAGRGGRCEEFDYGGCEGNGNNFDSYKDCRHTCSSVIDDCQRCRHLFVRLKPLIDYDECEATCKSAAPTYDIHNFRCPDFCEIVAEQTIGSSTKACKKLFICTD